MLLSNLANRGATPALIKTLAYNEARLKMISQNVANIHTPHYRTKQLDASAFRNALRAALNDKGSDSNKLFIVESRNEVRTDPSGLQKVTPGDQPVENVLFHDGTNQSIEQQMADLAETGMMHELSTILLRGRFEGLRKAIRGRV